MYTLFLRHLEHVSFLCVREGKRNGKSTPPPTAATWQGRRAVGQEPTGHSRAYLWSAFFSLQSELLCSLAYLCTLLLSFFFSLTHWNPKTGYKNNQKRHTFSSVIMLLRFFLSQTIYTDVGDTWKGITPFAGMEGKDLATSAEWFTTARHTLARMNDFHPLAPSQSDTQWKQGKGEHTYTVYINNGNVCLSCTV